MKSKYGVNKIFRHLTDTEYLMQEDLRQLIKALLDKGKAFKNHAARIRVHKIKESQTKLANILKQESQLKDKIK